MDSSSVLNFTVDKSLLNLEFEGYKLILQDIPVRQQALPHSIYQPEIGQNQYTLLHQHLFFSHNFLFHDFWWNPSDEESAKLYAFTSDGTVICLTYSRASETFTFLKMFDVSVPANTDNTIDKYNATLSFPSSEYVCISNGFGGLWICTRKKVWSQVFAAENFLGENKAFMLVDSVQRVSANGNTVIDLLLKTVDIAVVSVDKNFSTCFHWITFEENGTAGWTTERLRVVACAGRVEYSSFSRRQDIPIMCIVHAGTVRFVKDTKYLNFGTNVDEAAAAVADNHVKTTASEASDVIEASAASSSIEGQLSSIPDNEIETVTSRQAFNPEDMEECDMVSAEDLQLSWVHGEKHNVVRKADLSSHQWMFECRVSVDQPPYIVLRYDVDGLMWRVPSDPFEPGIDAEGYDHLHCATLHAFGYIQAAKESRRLVACSPDAAYSVIADQRRQVYVYWRPASPAGSELRNRRAACQKLVQQVSRQHLLTVDASQHILGLQALNSFLFVLTDAAIYAFLLPSPDQ